MILRMRFQRPRGIFSIGPRRPQRAPLLGRHDLIDAGQHHHAAIHIGNRTQQAGNRRRRGRDPRRDDEAPRRCGAPCRGHPVEQAIAPLGPVDPACPGQNARPMIDEQAESRQRVLPMFRKGAEVEVDQIGRVHLFVAKLVDHTRQPVGKLKGGRPHDRPLVRGRISFDQFGKQ